MKFDTGKIFCKHSERIFLMAIIILGVSVFCIPIISFPKALSKDVDVGSITKICELATLQCYYHNVAEYEKTPDGLFQYGIAKYGYKKIWMEYEGVVKIGIRGEKMQIGTPDANGVVQIYMPEAEILAIDVDKESLSDPIEEKGWLTEITSNDRADAFATAQSQMRDEAQANQSLLIRARDNAKLLIERYYSSISQSMEKQYKVAWMQNPIYR